MRTDRGTAGAPLLAVMLTVALALAACTSSDPEPATAPPPHEPSKAAPSSDDDYPHVTAECQAEAESAPQVTREQLDAWTDAEATGYLCLLFDDGGYSSLAAPSSEADQRPPLSVYDPAGPGDDCCFPVDNG